MPNEDVTIKAQFENIPALTSIGIITMPTKTTYTVGQALDLSGMVVRATYSGGSMATVAGWTSTPANGTVFNSPGNIQVTVSYTEGGVTKTTRSTSRSVRRPADGRGAGNQEACRRTLRCAIAK
jgi:hypothetical protein